MSCHHCHHRKSILRSIDLRPVQLETVVNTDRSMRCVGLPGLCVDKQRAFRCQCGSTCERLLSTPSVSKTTFQCVAGGISRDSGRLGFASSGWPCREQVSLGHPAESCFPCAVVTRQRFFVGPSFFCFQKRIPSGAGRSSPQSSDF